jgi:hypothetical protein
MSEGFPDRPCPSLIERLNLELSKATAAYDVWEEKIQKQVQLNIETPLETLTEFQTIHQREILKQYQSLQENIANRMRELEARLRGKFVVVTKTNVEKDSHIPS